jgi:hypothetical protein
MCKRDLEVRRRQPIIQEVLLDHRMWIHFRCPVTEVMGGSLCESRFVRHEDDVIQAAGNSHICNFRLPFRIFHDCVNQGLTDAVLGSPHSGSIIEFMSTGNVSAAETFSSSFHDQHFNLGRKPHELGRTASACLERESCQRPKPFPSKDQSLAWYCGRCEMTRNNSHLCEIFIIEAVT